MNESLIPAPPARHPKPSRQAASLGVPLDERRTPMPRAALGIDVEHARPRRVASWQRSPEALRTTALVTIAAALGVLLAYVIATPASRERLVQDVVYVLTLWAGASDDALEEPVASEPVEPPIQLLPPDDIDPAAMVGDPTPEPPGETGP